MRFEGVYNFRDLGGHRTIDDRTVRPGRLYRADDLSYLTPADERRFTQLGIRTVVDLRRPSEIADGGRIAEFDEFTYHNLHLVHPKWNHRFHVDTADRVAFLLERYEEMTAHGGEAIGNALRLIADPDRAPLIFHCLAGKDRTGIVAALALSLLGVDDDSVAGDYHRSDRAEAAAWTRHARRHGITAPNPRAHIEVSPRIVMLRLLADLRVRHGSIGGYVAELGVTPAHVDAMRGHLLTDLEHSLDAT